MTIAWAAFTPWSALLGGLAIGLVPHVSDFELAPELILTIVLPALLYWEALTTSLREVMPSSRISQCHFSATRTK